ncbi:cytidine and dCMP deaminase domain-containing protein 1 isoform X3 [Ornithorhynchus anatinus]|uniref:cytidine and dCMP deaminase domain-containing protein 1 isoform X3 n=1 Tax=Ornithorhynchus anatinus TaxID=9258 RepID=UPI0019D4C54F|nr:cytidine and dCMP deaminase domain-containing protein 1 isoform X3 [Ornithorhynchus anatinus]
MKEAAQMQGREGAGAWRSVGTQTGSVTGQIPRLSKVNLFTLLSLWMELFPTPGQNQESQKKEAESCGHLEKNEDTAKILADKKQVKKTGLVVVKNMKIVGLHCSSEDLHAGQIAVIKRGSRLKNCDLYFSRKPCSACLKMIVNAGVNRISYWPADPEISLHPEVSNPTSTEDAKLDAKAVERLKSNSRAHVCVLLQPLVYNMVSFAEETSYKCDFIQKIAKAQPDLNSDFYSECKQERIKEFEILFLVSNEEMHKQILMTIGLENLCENPYFSSLRQNMKDFILLLATVASSVPNFKHFGFYCSDAQQLQALHNESLSQEIARHCMVQARLLAYRTEPWLSHRNGSSWIGLVYGHLLWTISNFPGRRKGKVLSYQGACGSAAQPWYSHPSHGASLLGGGKTMPLLCIFSQSYLLSTCFVQSTVLSTWESTIQESW